MQKSIRNLLLGALVLVTQIYANPDAEDVRDNSVDSKAAAAIYTGDLLESNAMGMTSKRSIDLFPRRDCGHERFFCSHARECCLRDFGCCEHGGCTPPGWECCPGGSCPPGWSCCGTGRCVPPGGTCCDDGTYCDAGQVCVQRGHQMGCCKDPSCRGKGHYQQGIKYEYQPVHIPDTVTEYRIETVGYPHAPQITVIYEDRKDDYKNEHPKPEHPKPEHPPPEHPKPEYPKPEHPKPEHPPPGHPPDLYIPPEHPRPYPPHDPNAPYDSYDDKYNPGVYGNPYGEDAYSYTLTWNYYSYGTTRDDDETFITSVYVTDTTTIQIYADNEDRAINSFQRLTETLSLPTPVEATRLRTLVGLAPTSGSNSNALMAKNTWRAQQGWCFPVIFAIVMLAPGIAMILL